MTSERPSGVSAKCGIASTTGRCRRREAFRLDRGADRLERGGVPDRDPSARRSLPDSDDDELRAVLREGHARWRLRRRRVSRQLLPRARVDQADVRRSPPNASVSPSGLYASALDAARSGSGSPICSYVRASKKRSPSQKSATASVFPSGLTAIPPELASPRAVHDPDRRRRAQEVGEQVAAGLRRVVDRDRLAGEQEREVEVLLDERLRAEALGELGRLRVARLAALDDGEDPAGDGRRQQDRDPGEQRRAGAGWCAGRASSPARRPRGSR